MNKNKTPLGKLICPDCGYEHAFYSETYSFPVCLKDLSPKCPECKSCEAYIKEMKDKMNIEKPKGSGLYNFSWKGISFDYRMSFDFYEFKDCYIIQGMTETYKVDKLEDFIPKIKELRPNHDLKKAYIVTKEGEETIKKG